MVEIDEPKNKIDPLFDYGALPLMKFHQITEIEATENSYKYFLYNTKQPELSAWVFEDDLINLLKNKQKK